MKLKFIITTGMAGLLFMYGCKTHFPTTKESYNAVKQSDSYENGKNLTFNVCGQCHYDRHINSFIGEHMKDLPKFMGKIYSANLTNSPRQIMAKYSDAEFKYLLKTGIAHDGRFIPYMVRPTMADKDINDILLYLRSGDEPVAANDKTAGKTKMSAIGKLGSKIIAKPTPYINDIPQPSEHVPSMYGRYLIDIVGCYHCHSKSITGLDYVTPEKSKGYMAGGYKFKVEGKKIYASNITPDKETGIGHYTKEDFRKAVREGEAPGGRMLHYPMRRFKHLTDKQVDAMYAYIMTLEPKRHKVKGQPVHPKE